MITLKSDQLIFDFPEVARSLRELVAQHIEAIYSQVSSERREPAMAVLRREWRYQHASRREQQKAEERVLNASTEDVRASLERASDSVTRGYMQANLQIGFQRTLRIPDDNKVYPLPAGFGNFPLRDIDDFQHALPEPWLERGGVLMPMYQSEALWIYFNSSYPFAVKVGAGKVNAISGETLGEGLSDSPQSYLVTPEQPWLDGFAVSKGVIRQFVAMPLGTGYSVEEQLTRKSDVGGLQLEVFPMKAEACFHNLIEARLPKSLVELVDELTSDIWGDTPQFVQRCFRAPDFSGVSEDAAMGLGAGGKMQQEIFADPYSLKDWDQSQSHRCFVHLCNSMQWRQITGDNPPHPPFTINEYASYGIPWFDYYHDDLKTLNGSAILETVKSVATVSAAKGDGPLSGEATIEPNFIVQFGNRRRPNEVREWVS